MTALAYAQRRDGDIDTDTVSAFLLDPAIRVEIQSQEVRDRVEDQIQGLLIYRRGAHQLLAGGLGYWRDDDNQMESTYRYFLWNGQDWWPIEDATETVSQDRAHTDGFYSFHVQDIWRPHASVTIEGAVYWERIQRTNAFDQHRWTDTEVLPRLGVAWTPFPGDTFRIAAFRYLVPYAFERIDPQDIAGVTISRNTYEGALTEEADLVWEHEWSTGLFSANLFYLESADTWQYADGSDRQWNTRIVGLENAWNQMLLYGMGMRLVYRYLSVDDDFLPENQRKDHLAGITFTYVSPGGWRCSFSQGYRHLDFDLSTRDNENIWLTDLSAGFEFPGKRGDVSLAVNNLFDNQFNWVQDPFVLAGRAPARETLATLSIYF